MSGDGIVRRIADDLSKRHDAAVAERERLDRLIARHQRRRDSIRVPGAREFLEAVFTRVVDDMPGADFEIMGPFGLGCEYGVSIRENGGTLAHLSFRAGEGADAVFVDTSVDDGRFASGTLGRMNGLHHPARPLDDDLSVLVANIHAQIAENRLRKMAGR